MARKSKDELQKHTLNLRAGDVDKIAMLFPHDGATTVIRRIVSRFVDVQMASATNQSAEVIKKVASELES